ncbi:leucine-rich repeat serine/threonine-protein kinase 1-like [Sinocyclocheilus anshuiensis]|uniref:leucine-rich repeat serine/threonine-protein kinase 1-like n=1 Tax=Sinocyclocheilus anshuiensis TaxID=1608454 RepID=UPI0007BA896A|nr:PREDICTED: leucine-rich repeat serine/threonine-protein kinase 1-like [Sinocyclocheilus anshuiensis]
MSSYWYVKETADPGGSTSSMEEQAGVPAMGAKQSAVGSVPLSHSPTLKNIQEAYTDGEDQRARELIRLSCENNSGAGPDGVQLLCLVAQNGDLDGIRFLLQEARVTVPQEPSEENPAVLAAHHGHQLLVRELLDSIPRPCVRKDLLNWMLATACQQGHLEVVKLLVHTYNADAEDCAVHSGEFAIITGLPLYAAAQAANKEVACFLLDNGAGFSSYTLMDHADFSRQLLRQRHLQDKDAPADGTLLQETQAVHVDWSGLKLPWLDLDWFMDVSSRITVLDLSRNCLSSLPSVVPWGLIHLCSLNLCHNQLRELPTPTSSQEIICSRLSHVNVCENELECLPVGLLHLGQLKRIYVARNKLISLFNIPNGTNWIGLRKLQELDVSDNSLTDLPSSILHCLKALSSLNISRNKLSSFPDPWACPLNICKASSNQIEFLPDTISIFWKTHLMEVDISENVLKELPSYIFELEAIISLKLCGNQISTLPSPNKWKCSCLRTLDLSRNQLGKTGEPTKTRKLAFFTTWHRRDPEPVCPIQFPVILRDSLEVLFLNDNQLECVPPSVCALKNLSELYLSNNPGIQELPVELGQLSNLWQLDIEDLNITNIPADVRKDGPAAVLAYLRAELRGAEPCRLLKLMVVGPPRQGKSALLEGLQTSKPSSFTNTDRSIHTSGWDLERPGGVKSAVDSVSFNVWDIGGPASMSTVNQCFFTDKALFMVIWNLALGEEAVANLQSWLLNIEARAPNSAVIVVGTHLDLIDTKFRTERVATLRAYILALCRTPSGARASGYPDITWKHLHEVSCKTLEGMDGLKRLLFQVACSMKDISNPASCHKLVGRLIPKSYLTLQEAIKAERLRRDEVDEVQYLTDSELEQIIEQSPASDIKDYEDLQTAINFLIETGTMLHFSDTSHGLCKLYFLDAVWLSECLERIINLRGSRSVARNGVIKAEDLRMLLVGTRFTQQTEEQYFQFLAKFEIALPVASNSYLLPHLLPPKPALDIHGFRHQSNNSIQRHFKMSFVPAGFWERFIARMLISLNQMDVQAFETKRPTKNQRNHSTVIYSFAGNQQRNRCSTFRVRRSQTIYWKEGLLVTFDGGYLSVESSDLNWKKKKSGGIKIICQSETRDFSAMAFITDHVNALIEQWFPALTGSESDGSRLIEQYAPCPYCSSGPRVSDPLPLSRSSHSTVHYFNMEDCVLAAVDKEHITCPNHPKQPVPLQELVPELFMTDFPSRLFLLKSDLQCSEDAADILGQGGSGTIIYRAKYRGNPVAIKRFHFKKCKQQSLNSSTDTMMKHLQSMDAARSFSEFRQEASMLHSLQHPCIVALVGISIHPLCFALQLAPLGSLNTILEERAKGLTLGTPGYQAPEIRPGIVYDEKVDMFSYGMVLYELLSGRRPCMGQHQLQIAKKLSKGLRPALGSPEEVQFHCLQTLMQECWDTKPEKRPLAAPLMRQMQEPSFACLRYLLPCQEHSQLFLSPLQGHNAVFWDGNKDDRNYTVVNLAKGQVVVKRMPCPGTRLSCQMKMENSLWTATEEQEVFIYSLKEMCPLSHPQKLLSCPAVVTCLFLLPARKESLPQVFAGMSDGLVVVYSLVDDMPVEGETYICSHTINKHLLNMEDSDPRQRPYAVRSIVPVHSGSEVWYTNGPGVLVIDSLALQPIRRLEPYLPPSCVLSMVSSASCWGDEAVWCLDDHTNTLLMYHAASYQICATYNCSDANPLRDVFPVQRPAGVMTPVTPDPDIDEESLPATLEPVKVTVTHREDAGTQILCQQDSLDYCSMTSSGFSSEQLDQIGHFPHIERSSSGALSSLTSSSSMPLSADFEETDRPPDEPVSPESCPSRSATDPELAAQSHTPAQLKALNIIPVNSTIWVPRRGGDIMVIEVQEQAGALRARVIAVLTAPGVSEYGALAEAALIAKDTVVCGFRNENMAWCLAVWRSWGGRELELFYQGYEELGRLESSLRKRR